MHDEVRRQRLDADAFARFDFATLVGFDFIVAVKNLRQNDGKQRCVQDKT